MGFGQGLSGLNAASQDLDVIGNNIANAGTVGFKASSASFADVYASSRVGLGTQVSRVNQRFTVGTVEATGNQFDMAIDGPKGLFRLQDTSGAALYSRNGEFFPDDELFLVNAQRHRLIGYNVDANGKPGNALEPIRIPTAATQPEATANITFATNLDSSQPAIDAKAKPFNPDDATTYTKAEQVRIYDSLGNAHDLTQYFIKRPDAGGNSQWEVHYAGGATLNMATPTQTLSFNANGVLVDPTGPVSVDATVNTSATGSPAAPLAIKLSYLGSTQFNAPFSRQFTVDGHTAGEFISLSFDANGAIQANYTQGKPKILGYVALADFSNLQGLQPVGGNAWVETSASGQPIMGTPGTNGLATLKGQAVEKSNVEMGQELVKMIIAQRTYQANAQTIKTQDQVLQTLITMR